MKYQGKKFLSLPEQVEVNKRNIEQLKRDEYRTFTTLLAIENLSYLDLNQLVENSRDVSVGDLIYGSDAYYGQVTRVGGSVVEFTTVGLMPAGPKGDQGNTGIQGPPGPQGIQGIPGEVQLKDLPGYNLAMPNLTNAIDLGNGVYRLVNDNGFTIDYNVYNGVYTKKGIYKEKNYDMAFWGTLDFPIVARVIEDNGFTTSNFVAYNIGSDEPHSIRNKTGNLSSFNYVRIFGVNEISNFTFKLQIEKGTTITPYTIPGEIPQYATQEQEAWITPTLLNGWVNLSSYYTPMRYMKDSLGFVHVNGVISGGNNTTMFRLPNGYKPRKDIIFLAICNGVAIRCDLTSNGTVDLVGLPSSIDYASINLTFKAEV